ncbi:hypothetical protein [Hymenobacter volaticus]|uniref:DUF5056 domain-containing protein n=1 Tax=Hymenobacter volaticus TaxID=2932254 RepID=A0ABY4GCU6_9BACT|nr:hypothetical protein [Hymenobacter volaticus]UOQ68721.1 hypothetical protein MUN86_23695 [Hymenobacter volaticus]
MSHEEPKEDVLLGTLLREVDSTPTLPESFTIKMMAAIEMEAAEQATLYEPLLSRQAWRGIVLVVGLLFVVTGLLSVLPLYSGPGPDALLSFRAWLTGFELLQSARSTVPYTMGSPLVAAGGICLVYLLLDKWHSAFRQQQFVTKHRS